MMMMWLLRTPAGLELDTKPSICAARQHMLALCLGDCLSSMHIVRLFLSHTQKSERDRQREGNLNFPLHLVKI